MGSREILKVIKASASQRTCLVVQWLRLYPSTAGVSSVPGRGNKIPHAMWCGKKKKKSPSLVLTLPFFLFGIKIEYLETQRHFVALIMEVIMLKIVEQLKELQCLMTMGLQYQPRTIQL